MKEFTLICLTVTALFSMVTGGSGMEVAGCLTCHGFPGLARLEKEGSLKVLHIDEEAYMKSPHGAFSCRDCHVKTNKIPHAGVTAVDCSSRCHREKKDKALIAEDKYKTIHEGQQSVITGLDDQGVCRQCHPIYPHSREVFKRTVLNLHTGYIACEVCHLDRSKYEVLSHQWGNSHEVTFLGKPFGTLYDPRKKAVAGAGREISRIVSYVRSGGKSLPATELTAAAGNGAKEGMEINGRDDAWHRDIVKIDVKAACDRCHTKGGMVDFAALGFSKERIKELTEKNIVTVISGEEKFFLPGL